MNKKVMMLMLFPWFSAFAADEINADKVAKERAEWTKQYFAKNNTPIPDGGVTVVPEQQMSEYKTFKKQRDKERNDIRKYGYIKQYLPQVQSLLNFKEVYKNQFSGKSIHPTDEGLRHNLDEIEMAYDFHGVPLSAVDTMFGIAPSVTYIKNQGWAGAMQFFDKSGLGTCSYRENNLKFSHGSAIIAEEDATKDVNGNITVTNVIGEPQTGFMYSVDWYNNNHFRELKCANKQFAPSILNAALELARIIDSNG